MGAFFTHSLEYVYKICVRFGIFYETKKANENDH